MKVLSLALAMLASSCAMTVDYRAEIKLPVNRKKSQKIVMEMEEGVDTSLDAIMCGVSGIVFGGWCWAYMFMPLQGHRELVRNTAIDILALEFGDNYEIGSETFVKSSEVMTDPPRVKFKGNRGILMETVCDKNRDERTYVSLTDCGKTKGKK